MAHCCLFHSVKAAFILVMPRCSIPMTLLKFSWLPDRAGEGSFHFLMLFLQLVNGPLPYVWTLTVHSVGALRVLSERLVGG